MNRLNNKMSSRVLEDKQVFLTTNKEDFIDVVKKQKESDLWIRQVVGESKVVALDDIPIMAGTLRGSLNLVEASEDSDLADAMIEPGLALQAKDENGKLMLMPLRNTAITSILARGWISGSIFGRLKREEIADILNTCYSHFPETEGRILFRDGKVSAFHSSDYQVLPVQDLCETLMKSLDGKSQINGYKFKVGEISHERVVMDLEVEIKNRKAFEDLLKEMGITDTKLLQGAGLLVRLITSDIATSSAKVLPAISVGGSAFVFGGELAMAHKGKESSIAKFAELCEGAYSLLTTSMQKMSELGKMVMTNPEGALKGIAKRIGIPRREFYGIDGPWSAYNLLHSPQPTAAELYRYLWAYPQALEDREGRSNINAQEVCARSLSLDWAEFDHPFEW